MDSTAWLIREIDQINRWLMFITGHLFAIDGVAIVALLGIATKRVIKNGKNGRKK